MRHRIIAIALLTLLLTGEPSLADTAQHRQTETPPQAPRIETDQKTGAIKFIVKGREEARIDADGLHVRDDVAYM